MKLKRLLPITALVAVSPVVTLATSCSKDDIDVDIIYVREQSGTKAHITSQKQYNIQKDRWYEISIESDEWISVLFQDWAQITKWSFSIVTNDATWDAENGAFSDVRVKLDDLDISTQCDQDPSKLLITPKAGTQYVTLPYKQLEIDIDVKFNQTVDNAWFVFYCEKATS